MMTLRELLERAGARHVTDRRADCFGCGGRRTIAHSDEQYYCHHCGLRGNTVTLARQLGLEAHGPSAQELLAARHAAHQVAEEIRQRRWQLEQAHRLWLHVLDVVDEAARALGLLPDDEGTWGLLARAEAGLREARAELEVLDGASAAELLDYLEADTEGRQIWREYAWRTGAADYSFPGRGGSDPTATLDRGGDPRLPSWDGGRRGQVIAPAVAAIFERACRAEYELQRHPRDFWDGDGMLLAGSEDRALQARPRVTNGRRNDLSGLRQA
jgi:hypothetical protein